MSEAPPPRIAIVGGGPGGLVLLNVLARNGIPATLYERDESPVARGLVGGTLDLHEGSGQAAMHGAGLFSEYSKHARPEGEELIGTDKTGVPLIHHRPTGSGGRTPGAPVKPEIDRRVLRQVLIDGAPEGSIKWGHAFVSATPSGDAWELSFANGTTTTADLVVGADGGRSRVRPLVSDAAITHTGWTTVEFSFDSRVRPDLAARVGLGSLFAYDEHKRIAVQRNGDGRIRVYATFPAPDTFGLPTDPDDAIATVLSNFTSWAPWLQELISCADKDAIYLRPLAILPIGHSWPHKKGITLVGDAMNLMSTFAGQGANVAMLAGLTLGQALASAPPGRWDAAVAEYEEKIRLIATEAASASDRNMKEALGDGGAQKFAARVKRVLAKLGIEPVVG